MEVNNLSMNRNKIKKEITNKKQKKEKTLCKGIWKKESLNKT